MGGESARADPCNRTLSQPFVILPDMPSPMLLLLLRLLGPLAKRISGGSQLGRALYSGLPNASALRNSDFS